MRRKRLKLLLTQDKVRIIIKIVNDSYDQITSYNKKQYYEQKFVL